MLGRVEALFEECADQANAPGELFGIGIAVPGPVEFDAGRPISPPIMPGWDSYSVPARFARYGVPVRIDNDVNVMALGEHTAGLGRGRENLVFVKIGTGIGAGIIVNGELYRGSQGCAGDIGHIQIAVRDRDDVICRCGNVNCLEALAGGGALARDGEAAARAGRSPFLRGLLDEKGAVDARDVALGAAHGDATCVELISHTGQVVGQAVAAMVNFFNPSLVVIGGGVAEAGDGLLATIQPGRLPAVAAALDAQPRRPPLDARLEGRHRRRGDDGRQRDLRAGLPPALDRSRRARRGRGWSDRLAGLILRDEATGEFADVVADAAPGG